MVRLSHPYMTAGKTIGLNLQTFVGKVMSLLFNTLSGFIITFLPRSNHLLISCYVPTISYSHVGQCSYRSEENYKVCEHLKVEKKAWDPTLGDQSHRRDLISVWDFFPKNNGFSFHCFRRTLFFSQSTMGRRVTFVFNTKACNWIC